MWSPLLRRSREKTQRWWTRTHVDDAIDKPTPGQIGTLRKADPSALEGAQRWWRAVISDRDASFRLGEIESVIVAINSESLTELGRAGAQIAVSSSR